jgi:ATP-dependent protease ClpP protease subunit
MDAERAKAFGLIDEVVTERPVAESPNPTGKDSGKG